MLAGAQNPDGRRGVRRLPAQPPRCRRRCPTSMYVFPVVDGVAAAGRLGDVRRPARPTRYAVDPADIAAHRDEWLQRVERRHQPVRPDDAATRRAARPCAGLAAVPGAGAGRLLRAAGRRDARARASGPTARFDPGGGARGARPAAGAPGRCGSRSGPPPVGDGGRGAARPAGRARPAPAARSRAGRWSARRCWCRSCCRPSWSASPSAQLLGEAGPLGFLGLDGTRGRDHRRPGLLQRRRGDPGRRRRLGVARPAARPRRRPRSGATPGAGAPRP